MADHKARAHAILSASSSARWLACTRSAIAELKEPDEESPFAEEGTRAHEVAEQVARGLKITAGGDITQEMIRHAEEYAAYIQTYTTNDSTVLLEQRLDFSPWVPEGFGTGDCLILDDGHLTIIDYKYGVGVPVSAQDNSQMKLYALGALNDYGSLYDVDTVTMCIYQPRIGNVSEAELPAAELMDWAETVLRPAAVQAFEGRGDYNPGPHCKFCKHAGKCRKLASVCTETFKVKGNLQRVENLAPWEYDEILRLQPMIELWLKRVAETAMKKIIAGEEIPGQKLVEGRSTRKWDNPGQVQKELAAVLPAEEYLTEPELMSVAQLEKSIGKNKVAELVGPYITRAPGKISLAPREDKRPEYNPGGDFEKID